MHSVASEYYEMIRNSIFDDGMRVKDICNSHTTCRNWYQSKRYLQLAYIWNRIFESKDIFKFRTCVGIGNKRKDIFNITPSKDSMLCWNWYLKISSSSTHCVGIGNELKDTFNITPSKDIFKIARCAGIGI